MNFKPILTILACLFQIAICLSQSKKEQIISLENKVDNLENIIEDLRQNKDEITSTYNALSEELKNLQFVQNELLSSIETLSTMNTELQSTIHTYQQTLSMDSSGVFRKQKLNDGQTIDLYPYFRYYEVVFNNVLDYGNEMVELNVLVFTVVETGETILIYDNFNDFRTNSDDWTLRGWTEEADAYLENVFTGNDAFVSLGMNCGAKTRTTKIEIGKKYHLILDYVVDHELARSNNSCDYFPWTVSDQMIVDISEIGNKLFLSNNK
jgi:hypothetical protein